MSLLRMRAAFLPSALALFVFYVADIDRQAAAQDDPGIGPSGIAGEDAAAETIEDLSTTPTEPFAAEGGADVPLGGRNEPAIAVNPLDPTNVVVARLFAIRVSTDSGTTFSAATPAPVPATHSQAGDPSLAFDNQGRLFWTYLGQRFDNGNLDVFIAQVIPPPRPLSRDIR